MEKFLAGKLKKNLAEVVKMIELGEAGVAAEIKAKKEQQRVEAQNERKRDKKAKSKKEKSDKKKTKRKQSSQSDKESKPKKKGSKGKQNDLAQKEFERRRAMLMTSCLSNQQKTVISD
jgi:hypothetical protein